MKKVILFLTVATSFVLCAVQSDQFIVFNVGQGNCNLFLPKDLTARPLLYDCGMHGGKAESETNWDRNNTVAQIMNMLDIIKINYVNKELSVVISHGDADHHSYIKEILEKLIILEPTIKYYFYLGGIKSQYPGVLTKFIDDLLPVRRKCVCYTNTDGKLPPVISAGYAIDVLAWPYHISGNLSEKKNSNSLMLKITFGAYSILLTGDATGKTFDYISKRPSNPIFL